MRDAPIRRGWHKAGAAHARSRGGYGCMAGSCSPVNVDAGTTLNAEAAPEAGGDISVLHHATRGCDQETARSAIPFQPHEIVKAHVWLGRSARTGVRPTKLRRATIDTMLASTS
jgi:hypothetical protein